MIGRSYVDKVGKKCPLCGGEVVIGALVHSTVFNQNEKRGYCYMCHILLIQVLSKNIKENKKS